MVNLGLMVKTASNKALYAVNVINEDANESSVKNAEKIMDTAVKAAVAADSSALGYISSSSVDSSVKVVASF